MILFEQQNQNIYLIIIVANRVMVLDLTFNIIIITFYNNIFNRYINMSRSSSNQGNRKESLKYPYNIII